MVQEMAQKAPTMVQEMAQEAPTMVQEMAQKAPTMVQEMLQGAPTTAQLAAALLFQEAPMTEQDARGVARSPGLVERHLPDEK